MLLSKPIIHMPELSHGEWLNSAPLTRAMVRGRVVLVDFWDYSCVNCLRTLPYLVAWHKRYTAHGLLIMGIHTPEFKFGQQRPQVEAAVAEHGLSYPILLDNAYQNWEQFANKAWPTKYLIDPAGYIRYMRRGEGGYRETELAIQQLLKAHNPHLDLPEVLHPLRAEDGEGAVCYKTTAELFAGYASGGLFGAALGNPEGYLPHENIVYELPPPANRQPDAFYVEGIWRAWPESLAFVGRDHGRVLLRYSATGVNAVLSPSADEVELRLGLHPPMARVTVRLDGRPLRPAEAGADVHLDETGTAVVTVTRPRMVHLVQHPTHQTHELELTFHTTGLALHTFSFTTSCR